MRPKGFCLCSQMFAFGADLESCSVLVVGLYLISIYQRIISTVMPGGEKKKLCVHRSDCFLGSWDLLSFSSCYHTNIVAF